MSTVVIVPVRDQPALTKRFLECMSEQAIDSLLVLDNGSGAKTVRMLQSARRLDQRIERHALPGLSIYELWNHGADLAEKHARDETNLLVANNDVELPPQGVAQLAGALRSRRDLWAVYPDDRYPFHLAPHPRGIRLGTGVARTGGLYGPCFMVALDRIPWRPLISDTSYEWWFGDDHLARQIEEEGGKHGRLLGLPVLHEHEGTARHHPETQQMRQRDRRRWMTSQRGRRATPARRRVVPGTRVWYPGGKSAED